MSFTATTFRWLQRKRYQYEVTFSLYMLTPTEKFIFNSFLFLFFSMIIIAAILYLPHHLAFLTNRAWFYYNGPETTVAAIQPTDRNAPTAVFVERLQEKFAGATTFVPSASSILQPNNEL